MAQSGRLHPWRHRTSIFPRDPVFAEKAGRILDLYQGLWNGEPLAETDCVLSTDEKTSIQARPRCHRSLPPAPGRPMRVEQEYVRGGAWEYGDKIRELPWRVGSGMRKGAATGHLFCATVGERIYLRFVPSDPAAGILGELGTCLRLLECTEDTPRVLNDELARAIYDAWAKARTSILEAWTFETDPANLQPRIRKLNRDVAAFLRANPPPDVPQDRLHRALDAVESPWPRREENLLRLVWERAFLTNTDKARALAEEIERIGAEPFHAPGPLPPISEEEIHLITWMAIAREADESAA